MKIEASYVVPQTADQEVGKAKILGTGDGEKTLLSQEKTVNETKSADREAETSDNEPKAVAEAIEKIQEYTKLKDVGLHLKVDEELDNRIVVKLIDKESEEVIRQIPSEEALELAKHLKKVFDGVIQEQRDVLAGQFLDDKV